MIKIKFELFTGEIVNCYAKIIKTNKYYELYFDDNISYDKSCLFNLKNKCFYGCN